MLPQQGAGMNRGNHLQPSMSSSNDQNIPGMPLHPVMSSSSAPAGFQMQHSYSENISIIPGSINQPLNQFQNKPWPQASQQHFKQQDTSNQQLLQQQKDIKHRDYLKQQQRLKAMPLSSSKGMSADALIGNLLEKKDTFTPRQSNQGHGKQVLDQHDLMRQQGQCAAIVGRPSLAAQSPNDSLPGWLLPTSSRLPPIFSHIWSLVSDPSSGGTFVDTNKILALLLTSGLPKEVLGFIWNLATNGVNGQLNQQQLYITLALVALAQMGCTFNNLSVLNFIPTPPIPTFNMNVPKSGADDKMKQSEIRVKQQSPTDSSMPLPSTSGTSLATNSTIAFSSETMKDDFADDFADFQSADTSNCLPSHTSNVSATLPATAVIQPSIAAKQVVNELNHSVVGKLGHSQGRSIGSRLANHTLGAPKVTFNQRQRHASVDNDNLYIQDDFNTEFEKPQGQYYDSKSQNNSENEDFSDFQIGAGLDVNVDELFPKCHLKAKHQDMFLRESAIRNESDEESIVKDKEEQLLAFDSPTSIAPAVVEWKKPPAKVEIPLVAPPPSSKPTKELMSIEEDRYSALRLIESEASNISTQESLGDVVNTSGADDFGDFVSADDPFAELAVRDSGSCLKPNTSLGSDHLCPPTSQSVEFPIDDWGPSNFHSPQHSSQQAPAFSSNGSSETKTKFEELSSSFAELDISKGYENFSKVEESQSKWSFDFDIGKESTGPNLTASLNVHSSQNDDDFGDFIGPESAQMDNATSKTSSAFLNDQLWSENSSNIMGPRTQLDNRSISSLELQGMPLSRHGSLPSLDLNLFPASDDMSDKALVSQVVDWLRCLESSCLLLQAAASTFTSISSHTVLMEVLGATEGRNYLNNLLEVHRVSWRIQRSYQRSCHESNQMDTILTSIQKVWSTLQTFYKLANIETAVEKDGSDEESGQPACGVCGSPASRGVLEYGGHVYHAPCANLWLNCVDRTLPTHSPLL